MALVMKELGIPIPRYTREDAFVFGHACRPLKRGFVSVRLFVECEGGVAPPAVESATVTVSPGEGEGEGEEAIHLEGCCPPALECRATGAELACTWTLHLKSEILQHRPEAPKRVTHTYKVRLGTDGSSSAREELVVSTGIREYEAAAAVKREAKEEQESRKRQKVSTL